MKQKIEDILFKIGVSSAAKGFQYIVDAVVMLDGNPRMRMTEMYRLIGENHGTTQIAVERAIRYAFGTVQKTEGNQEAVERYIGEGRKTNKQNINRILLIARREMEHEKYSS